MKRNTLRNIAASIALAGAATLPVATQSADAQLDCEMRYSLDSWSIIYKRVEGYGTITCENGDRMNVRISARGGGLTVGKSHIDNGRAEFSDVRHISDVLGSYVMAEAHAGVVKSSSAQVMTKGEVSMVLAGTGEGVDLGIDFGRLTISSS